MVENKTTFQIKNFIFLHLVLILYSFSSVCSKIASGYAFLSSSFLVFYGLSLAFLMIYAFLWQKVLKKMPLVTAFSNKAIEIVWGMIWGVFLFHDIITIQMVIGAVVIFIGIIVVVSDYAQ